jgi:DNA helicase-2/ATP-dependent DNA helicase PcrA
MDKRVIFAVAGSGKTTYIVDNLSKRKRSLIVTYTIANYNNLSKKIAEKFNGTWPECITLMTYFTFLYRFCYKPYLSDAICGARRPQMRFTSGHLALAAATPFRWPISV